MACYRQAVSLRPAEPLYHIGLATAADGAGQDALAEQHAAEAARLDPDNPLSHHLLARWCHRKGQLARGIEHSARAVALAPDTVEYTVLHATLLFACDRAREARDAIERPLAAGSDDRWLANLFARIAPVVKQEAAALQVVEKALLAPGLPDTPGGKPLLHFAASALLDRMGRYPEAFDCARRGNEILRDAAPKHEIARHAEWISRKIGYFTRDRINSLPRATHGSRRPVFILGMPRSGTTLVEHILGCHPSVHPGGELQALRLVARDSADTDWAVGASYPEYFDDLSVGRANRLAAQYLSAIDAIDTDATYVTDKMPLNMLALEMVELLLPGCRVIHCVRGALDTCLSCYMTNFEQHNAFKFDLAHLGAFYRDYLRLMEHWKKVLTVPILEVRYEDLVLDTRGQLRRMLEFLELPWDDRCLRYYQNDRPVHTASVDQVRRPIYTASIGRWKHYEKHLAPLIAALGTSA